MRLPMGDRSGFGVVVFSYDCGFWIPTSPECHRSLEKYSESFKCVLRMAYESGATFLRLDGSGHEYEELPRFDW